jgi:hypothetical protein
VSLLIVLLFVDLLLAVGSAAGKVPGWAVDFAIVLTLFVAFWGR